ncbi:hypothetical protein IAD21_06462 (plasmid) [Abditibacteriota bacterium]|nr:hypothetical protein IAD21_06462 [Abditibacteriota bacterium]
MSEATLSSHRIRIKLQVTNGYFVQFDQLAQLLGATCRDERPRIPQDDLANAVGVAGRKIENLASIAQALGLIAPVTYKPTPLGEVIAAQDPFLDDIGTLWLMHYIAASEPRFLVWNRFVNEFLPARGHFSYADLRGSFDDLKESHSTYTAKKHVTQEVKVLLDAYTEQALSRLAYLRADGDNFRLSYREPLPPLVLAACLARFRDRHRAGATALSIDELLTAPNSPGRICLIPADRLRSSLETLRAQSGFALESRADLDQVRLTDSTSDHQWMERYYASR